MPNSAVANPELTIIPDINDNLPIDFPNKEAAKSTAKQKAAAKAASSFNLREQLRFDTGIQSASSVSLFKPVQGS